jgi:hypothetical protein
MYGFELDDASNVNTTKGFQVVHSAGEAAFVVSSGSGLLLLDDCTLEPKRPIIECGMPPCSPPCIFGRCICSIWRYLLGVFSLYCPPGNDDSLITFEGHDHCQMIGVTHSSHVYVNTAEGRKR